MKIKRITRDQVYRKLDKPFNPPDAESESEQNAFFSEWYSVRSNFLHVLEQFGDNDEYDQKDFNLGDSSMLSRGIGVVFTNVKMFQPVVIEAVVLFLCSLKEAYEVNVMLEDNIGQHALFISKSEILSNLPEELHKKVIPSKWK